MALIDVGMTRDEILASRQPLPAGRYRVAFVGFFQKDKNDPKSKLQTTDAGNLMLTAKLKPISKKDGTVPKNQSNLLYNAVLNSFSSAELVEAIPNIFGETGFDENGAMNSECWADVEPDTYQGRPVTKIAKLLHINIG